jgi:low temperature requirement protein LtrA
VWALGQAGERAQQNTFVRNADWFAISGVLWIAGAFMDSELRVVLWALALLIEQSVPWAGFWLPGLGRS